MSYFRPPFSPETPPNTQPPAKRLTRLEGYAMSSLSAGMGIAYMAAGIEQGSVWREIIFGIGTLGLLVGVALFVLSGIRRIQRRRATSLPHAALHALKMTGLLILLPAAVLCAGIIVWAIMTGKLPV